MFIVFFFFKQKTAYEIYQCDWSSDVCSSDLEKLIELLYFFQPCDPKIESLEHRTVYAQKIMKLINQMYVRKDEEGE